MGVSIPGPRLRSPRLINISWRPSEPNITPPLHRPAPLSGFSNYPSTTPFPTLKVGRYYVESDFRLIELSCKEGSSQTVPPRSPVLCLLLPPPDVYSFRLDAGEVLFRLGRWFWKSKDTDWFPKRRTLDDRVGKGPHSMLFWESVTLRHKQNLTTWPSFSSIPPLGGWRPINK